MSMAWGIRIGREGSHTGTAAKTRAGVPDNNLVLCYDRSGRPISLARMQRDIDRSWRSFWHKRGLACPPQVSRDLLGNFNLPEAA